MRPALSISNRQSYATDLASVTMHTGAGLRRGGCRLGRCTRDRDTVVLITQYDHPTIAQTEDGVGIPGESAVDVGVLGRNERLVEIIASPGDDFAVVLDGHRELRTGTDLFDVNGIGRNR